MQCKYETETNFSLRFFVDKSFALIVLFLWSFRPYSYNYERIALNIKNALAINPYSKKNYLGAIIPFIMA